MIDEFIIFLNFCIRDTSSNSTAVLIGYTKEC